ncbi:AAA family ATPase [Candidatus Berkelbacteria bacterium]|nr:AAA family ATPase [Candidatus Berkelbacteria bacterium]
MGNYQFSPTLAAQLKLAVARMKRGQGAVLLLEGEPGGGKTSFARALAESLGGRCFYYSGCPDKERDLLYAIDVQGVLERTHGWEAGPAWEAFEATKRGEYSVLLVDEVDKTHPGFDAFLLRLLQEFAFRAPGGTEITADAGKLAVVLTSNGRRVLRPELRRRCKRVQVPLPTGDRLRAIIRQLAAFPVPAGLLELVIRLGEAIRQANKDEAPAPQELAGLTDDLLTLAAEGEDNQTVWRAVASGWLVKSGEPALVDKVARFNWAAALQTECSRPVEESACA